jgi:ribonuclease HI
MSTIVIHTDGGARGNPGPSAAGVVIQDGDTKHELKKYLGRQTNNWAEYEALILALAEAKRLGFTDRAIEVRMDSELIVKQMSGEYRVKDVHLKEKNAAVRELMTNFESVCFVHIPRERNKEADRLVNEVIDEAVI